MARRRFLLAALATPPVARAVHAATPRLEVFKSPTCGCRSTWIDHLAEAGFDVTSRDLDQDALRRLKARTGLSRQVASCHAGFADGYVVEGHVPAEDVKALLAERHQALGLAVPGMPVGSPGMEMGARRDPFDTLPIARDGGVTVFRSHGQARRGSPAVSRCRLPRHDTVVHRGRWPRRSFSVPHLPSMRPVPETGRGGGMSVGPEPARSQAVFGRAKALPPTLGAGIAISLSTGRDGGRGTAGPITRLVSREGVQFAAAVGVLGRAGVAIPTGNDGP